MRKKGAALSCVSWQGHVLWHLEPRATQGVWLMTPQHWSIDKALWLWSLVPYWIIELQRSWNFYSDFVTMAKILYLLLGIWLIAACCGESLNFHRPQFKKYKCWDLLILFFHLCHSFPFSTWVYQNRPVENGELIN